MRAVSMILMLIAVLAPMPAAADEPAPKIALYTMGRGDVIWQKFGHAAICVEYERNPRRSACYNYGTTDFSDPIGVGWGFLRGQGRFWVSATTPAAMIRIYKAFDRTLWRQDLPLTDAQARAIAAKLAYDYQPENRYYTYHHFHDNCTTRVRDIIDEGTGGLLARDTEQKPGPTFREFARQGLADTPYVVILSDLFLGRGADVQPTLWQAMFLPWYLRDHVRERLGAEPVMIYQRQGPDLTLDPGWGGRDWLLGLAIFLCIAVAVPWGLGRCQRAGVITVTVPLFLLGLIVWFLAVVTAVEEFRYNEILAVFVPLDLALPFLGAERRRLYARIRVASLLVVALLMITGLFTQPLWAAMTVPLLPLAVLALPSRRQQQEAPAADKAPPKKAGKSSAPRKPRKSRRR